MTSAADDLRRAHFDALRGAVAATAGTEVKTIGDALMVSYTSAADAIAGAVAMQQSVDQLNRSGGGPALAMRVGLSAGDATFEEGDWFGAPVVEAARLCEAAAGGQILLTDIVRVLAGSRSEHEIRAVGDVEAKGLPVPLVACEVAWAPLDPDGTGPDLVVTLPSAIEHADAFAFVGRATEHDVLVDSWKEAMTGECRTVLVAGEPGIGKTRLVREVCRLAHDQGAVVLWGGCEDELGIPFQPFAEALRGFAHTAPPSALADLVGPLSGELVRLIPDLPQLVADVPDRVTGDPDAERYRLFEAVADLLVAVSTHAPVVLVLDDLHWAGKPSLLLLRHILRSAEQHPVLVIVTYRDTDLDRTHPLADMLADLRRQRGVDRIALTGLDLQGVASFMEHTAGHELEEDGMSLAASVHAETEGNPFFVGEVLLHLAESGALVLRDGRWTTDLPLDQVGIPEGVREVVGRRLSHLDQATNDVMTLAAVIGREFEVGMLGSLVDGGQEAALDAIEAAEASGLVVEGTGAVGSYRFSHALVRTTLYDELGTTRRLRLHRDVALALVDRADADERLAELARHFAEAAALGEVDRAVEWGRRAGDAAMAELAWEEAATHYGRALDALDVAEDADPLVRCDLLMSSGRALKAVSDPRAEDLLAQASELARTHQDAARLADATLLLCGQRFEREAGEVDASRVSQIEEALDALAGSDPGRRALLLSAEAGELVWSGDAARRRRLADEALELARGTGDREVLGQVLNQRGYVFDSAQLGGIDEYLAASTEVIDLAGDLGDRVLLCRSHLARSPVLIIRGDRQQGEADLRDAEALVTRLRQPALEHRAMVLRTAGTLLSGRLAEAEELSGTASAFAQRHGLPDAAAAHAYRLHYERGTLDELEPLFAELAEAQPTIHIIRAGLLGVYTTTDRYEEAGVHLRALAADDWAMVPTDGTWIVSIAGAARTAGIIGDLEIAARAYELARSHSGQLAFTGQSFEQPVALSVGTAAMALGRHDEAEALFGEAVELCTAADAPTFVAATRAQWAELCLARNDPGDGDRALELATQALETAQAFKLGRVEVLSRRVLDRL